MNNMKHIKITQLQAIILLEYFPRRARLGGKKVKSFLIPEMIGRSVMTYSQGRGLVNGRLGDDVVAASAAANEQRDGIDIITIRR
jgi:hypothetical protein